MLQALTNSYLETTCDDKAPLEHNSINRCHCGLVQTELAYGLMPVPLTIWFGAYRSKQTNVCLFV